MWPTIFAYEGSLQLFLEQKTQYDETSDNLQGKTRQAEADVLECCAETSGDNPFCNASNQLVCCDNKDEQRQCDFVETIGHECCAESEKPGLNEENWKSRSGRHAEKQVIDKRRCESYEQPNLPAVFVCADEGEEIDRQEDEAALRNKMAELWQCDIAYNKKQSPKHGFVLLKA